MTDIQAIDAADPNTLAGFDDIIDVRSPAEFAEDHAPGAINLPVLDNEERAVVGTIYVQESRFKARRLGAALVARNIARHLETTLSDRPAQYRPLIYCWRGGQRSNAMATVLNQVGWRTAVLAGGYRTYRRRVKARLYDDVVQAKLVLIDGRTGSGKTEILQRVAARGVQILDLEALAQHRGSLLGALPGVSQPSQKMFESRLLNAIEALDLSRPVLVEAEASKVGERMIPPALWKVMTAAPRILLAAPLEARAAYLAARYASVALDLDAFGALLERMPTPLGRKTISEWLRLAEAQNLEAVAAGLVQAHYDPAYDRALRKESKPRLADLELQGLGEADQEAAADRVAALAGERLYQNA